MMKTYLGLIILLGSATGVVAANKNDFAYGYNLEVDGDGAIYSLTLPEDVYRSMTRADHGDLRVFNSRGETVPHALRREEQKLTTQHAAADVPIFPLYASADGKPVAGGVENVHITTNEQGGVIDINYGKGSMQSRQLSGYLLDLSALDSVPNALEVQWPQTQTDFVLAVHIEGSDDLNHWGSLVGSATLSHLQYGDHQLIQQRIELPLRKVKYLRLGWDKQSGLVLEKVSAQFPESIQAQPRQWSEVPAGEPTSNDSKEQIYLFDAKCFFPVDRLAVHLPQHNSVVQGVIESSDRPDGNWSPLYRGMLYDLQQQGTTLTTPELILPITTQRYWRLRLPAGEALLHGLPSLKLGWIPEQLLFTAQGEAPFILAFGSVQVQPVTTVLSQLLHQDTVGNNGALIKPARLGARITLGDRAQLVPPPPALPWKKWILWAVLVGGVIILAFMAYRLVKQMNTTGHA